MILNNQRDVVIANIKNAVEKEAFHEKVEPKDPKLTTDEKKALLERYQKRSGTLFYKMNRCVARKITEVITKRANRSTKIVGMENVLGLSGGAIITSNHFSPMDNTIIRTFVRQMGKKTLYVIGQEANLAMGGLVGYLMNYADMLPIGNDYAYMKGYFTKTLETLLLEGNFMLIYPEQEMWFHYRKPRPQKRGAYYYAAKLQVPVISCFVEMRNLKVQKTKEFSKVQYILHILPPIFPDSRKTLHENSVSMCRQDYLQKKAAYEKAYHKPLCYAFEKEDIAGWIAAEK